MQTPGQTWIIDITKCRRQPRRRLTFPHKLFVRFLLSHDGRPVRDARFFYCSNSLTLGILNRKKANSHMDSACKNQLLRVAKLLLIPLRCIPLRLPIIMHTAVKLSNACLSPRRAMLTVLKLIHYGCQNKIKSAHQSTFREIRQMSQHIHPHNHS